MEEGYSQAPVVDDGILKGTISESSILEKVSSMKENMKVNDAMEECLPTIPPDTPRDEVVHLLRTFQAVIVSSQGSIKGIITRADIVKDLN